mgnify:CR=1 FL=1
MEFHKGWSRLNKQLQLLDKLPPDNRDILKKFAEYLISEGISPLRILRYVQIMRIISQWVETRLKSGKDEIIKVLGIVEKKNYKTGTKNEFRKAMKKFF